MLAIIIPVGRERNEPRLTTKRLEGAKLVQIAIRLLRACVVFYTMLLGLACAIEAAAVERPLEIGEVVTAPSQSRLGVVRCNSGIFILGTRYGGGRSAWFTVFKTVSQSVGSLREPLQPLARKLSSSFSLP